ncbi:hypothetical protein ColLi_06516 [Colletotrichum liriopes]|uniref:NACHT domain-containing protein n=1 Tax=Colletotrichum liriopes TaxID=708192 RepID=A0AA37GP50_9PEZI|nr:hypothetical protein ColLi_06516 [Colletotrichum liriopes]
MTELVAIGLASNLLQFAEFGTKLFILARESYKSGSIGERDALEAEAGRLLRVSQEIRDLCKGDDTSTLRSELRAAAKECDETARTLIEYLRALQKGVKDQKKVYNRIWASLSDALRHMSHAGETKNLERKLEKVQTKLRVYLAAASAREQATILRIVKNLEDQNAKLETRTTERLEDMANKIETATEALRNQQADEFSEHVARYKKEMYEFGEEMNRTERKQRILQGLQFNQMKDRQDKILPEHETTFNWVFEEENTKFPQWLESQGGIFWIRGKPGSGKSTLMKFLVGHATTKAKLQVWSQNNRVAIASHYFWITGNVMQKSRRGLLQTLLFDVLRELPQLIDRVCSSRWTSPLETLTDSWTESELMAAFDALAQQTEKDLAVKFCFFIDGLDEYTAGEQTYNGMFEDLLQTLYNMVSLPCIKICVSSRPWNAFDLSLGPKAGDWRIQVEDLTKDDIKKYVKDKLEGSDYYKELEAHDGRFSQIPTVVVQKAEGVFLWVYLIVKSLITGLSKADTYEELLRRLSKIPGNLKKYFRHMLESIERDYWESTSRIFRVMIASGQPLPLLAFEFLDQEEKDPQYALHMSLDLFSTTTISSTYKRLRKRVEARGRDLLQISKNSDARFLQLQVDFLHRTVRDFFRETRAMDETLQLRETNDFSPLVSLCRIMLACGKALPYPTEIPVDFNQVFLFADGLMYYAWRIEDERSRDKDGSITPTEGDNTSLQDSFELLDELDRSNTQRLNKDGFHWSNYRELPNGNFKELRKKTFLATAIQSRLTLYVEHKIKCHNQVESKAGRPLLDYALRPTMITPLQPERPIPEGPVSPIVKYLLNKGANPNQRPRFYDEQSLWELFLAVCLNHSTNADKYNLKSGEIAETMLAMLSHGADTHAWRETRGHKRVGILEIAQGLDLTRGKLREIESLISEKQKEEENKMVSSGVFGFFQSAMVYFNR